MRTNGSLEEEENAFSSEAANGTTVHSLNVNIDHSSNASGTEKANRSVDDPKSVSYEKTHLTASVSPTLTESTEEKGPIKEEVSKEPKGTSSEEH